MTHPYLDNVNMSNFLGRIKAYAGLKHIFGSIFWKTRSLVPLICGTSIQNDNFGKTESAGIFYKPNGRF